MNAQLKSQLFMLSNAKKKINSLYHEEAVRLGISETALWILYSIFGAEETFTQYDLCEAWQYPRQTVNSAITSLIKNGYVVLKVIPGTRNRKAIHLTESGLAFCEKNILPLYLAEERAYLQMSEKELDTFVALYEKQYVLLKKEFGSKNDETTGEKGNGNINE